MYFVSRDLSQTHQKAGFVVIRFCSHHSSSYLSVQRRYLFYIFLTVVNILPATSQYSYAHGIEVCDKNMLSNNYTLA